MKNIFLLFIISFSLASCQLKPKPNAKELMQVDKGFSAFAVEKGWKKAFIEFAHPDAVLLRENSMPIVGKQEVINLMEDTTSKGPHFSWKPLDAKISSSNDMGFTYGIYTIKADTLEEKGTYVSIWVKDGQGKWKYILDTGNKGLGE